MLQQLFGKSDIVQPHPLGEPELLAKNLLDFFRKKETVLVSLSLTNGLN